MSHLFLGSNHAALYAKFRPTTPQVVIDKIVSYLSEGISGPLNEAADVGCGSGQSSRILSPYFKKVTGTDVSENQLEKAKQHPENPANVTFTLSTAETLPFEEDSLQLISAGQSFHWFDQEKFFETARRILVPKGVVALYGYVLPFIRGNNEDLSNRLEKLILRFHDEDVGKYWDERRDMIMGMYKGVKLPFKDFVRDDNIIVRKEMRLKDYVGLLRTWSAFQTLIKEQGEAAGEDILQKFQRELLRELSMDENDEGNFIIHVSVRYFLLMGRK